VRARAVAAIGRLDPAHRVRAAGDPAPEVRTAFAATASEPELQVLAGDPAPEVRAAALAALSVLAGAAGGRTSWPRAPRPIRRRWCGWPRWPR